VYIIYISHINNEEHRRNIQTMIDEYNLREVGVTMTIVTKDDEGRIWQWLKRLTSAEKEIVDKQIRELRDGII